MAQQKSKKKSGCKPQDEKQSKKKARLVKLKSKDYALISFIGVCFSIFLIPILKNIQAGSQQLPLPEIDFIFWVLIALSTIALSNLALYLSFLVAKKIPVFLQIAKFTAVGVFNTFLDWSVVNFLIFLTGTTAGVTFSSFNILSFVIANTASFIWNKYWIFQSQKKKAWEDYLQFITVSALGLVAKLGIITLIVDVIGPVNNIDDKIWANLALVISTMFFMVWNFLGYKFIVFKK